MFLPDWLPIAIMRLPRAAIRVVTYLVVNGTVRATRDGALLIVSSASYRELRRGCDLTATGVAFGIRTAKAEGWLVPIDDHDGTPTMYLMPYELDELDPTPSPYTIPHQRGVSILPRSDEPAPAVPLPRPHVKIGLTRVNSAPAGITTESDPMIEAARARTRKMAAVIVTALSKSSPKAESHE